ncbi:hypothetical protein L1887_02673 [Cichorium endivia]|nr:hypothetical protein L1887_02673 [Cichorium endivia]
MLVSSPLTLMLMLKINHPFPPPSSLPFPEFSFISSDSSTPSACNLIHTYRTIIALLSDVRPAPPSSTLFDSVYEFLYYPQSADSTKRRQHLSISGSNRTRNSPKEIRLSYRSHSLDHRENRNTVDLYAIEIRVGLPKLI